MTGKLRTILTSSRLSVKILLGILLGILLLVLTLFIVSFFIDEPLRRAMERNMNDALDGYSVKIGELDFSPIGLSITLRDLVLTQDAHPDPPVATFAEIGTSIHWREIFSGRLVADWRLESPDLYINLRQLQQENKDEVPVEDRGWQDAVQSIYPLKINRLVIRNGRFTYIDEGNDDPLRLTGIHASASNILNIRSPDQSYPSPFRLEADIFEKGHGIVEGNADFLAQPHVGLKAAFVLRQIPLAQLGPVSEKANLRLQGGTLAGQGDFEFAPEMKSFHLTSVDISELKLDYVHSAATAAQEKKRAKEVKEAAQESARRPDTKFLIERLTLSGEAGMINKAADPTYRVFLSDADMTLTNFSDNFRRGPAHATLKGRFMGSGATAGVADFRPRKAGADLDLRLRIEGTHLPDMNDLLRAYGDFDVVEGRFSLYTEVTVRGNKIDGYVKPFFRDLDVYDAQQDADKGLLQKVYEAVVGGVGQLLENPNEKVATRADISGSLDNPDASTWQILVQLVRNAFFQAILPGFEAQASGKKD